MASYTVSDKWYEERERNIDDESERIVVAAAKLIKSAIQEMDCDLNTYPSCQIFDDIEKAKQWLPSLLNKFISNLVSTDIKIASLGHAIVQAVKPKTVIARILFGLGISLDQIIGSKTLINLLSRLGFCSSYDEITRFKQSVVQCEDDVPVSYGLDSFTQFAADNIDHNVCTIDGFDTFHGMGIISMSTPLSSSVQHFGETPVRRLPRAAVTDIVHNRGMPLLNYDLPPRSALTVFSFKTRQLLHHLFDKPISTDEDTLWHAGWFFMDAEHPRPGWSGFMHDLHQHSYTSPVQSAVITMFPIIDQKPNEFSTIYSTLTYVNQQAKRLSVQTPCITFDHPLWIKAIDIVHCEKLNIVCRLGPFHMLMSFLGSIGKVMSGSGLVEALQCCYGTNTISHMLSGKAVKRAVRGHWLIDSALKIILFEKLMISSAEGPNISSTLQPEDHENLKKLYNDVVHHRVDVCELSKSAILSKVTSLMTEQQSLLGEKSRTAKLWLQYSRYVDIIKSFIRAERVGDWALQLSCVAQMLNLFAAAGHCKYAKSARLYLQMMLELPVDYPWLHDKFMHEGFHTVRRSARVWADLSTDLTIEQTMMRALKGRSGLTHGRGMSESVRRMWVKTMHRSATIFAALCSFDKSGPVVRQSSACRCKLVPGQA